MNVILCRTVIVLFGVLLLSFSKQKISPSPDTYYILKVSWANMYHGTIRHYWVLEESRMPLREFEMVQVDSAQMRVVPLIFPRYLDEFVFCCEQGNINYLYAHKDDLNIDSLKQLYKKQFEKYYSKGGEDINLRKKKALTFLRDFKEGKLSVEIYKVRANICHCVADHNNPGSSYTDTIANFRMISRYVKFSNLEKVRLGQSINSIVIANI